VVQYLDVFRWLKPARPELDKACLVIYHFRGHKFLTGVTTLCNPVSLQVCCGDPDFIFGPFSAHIVAAFAFLAVTWASDSLENRIFTTIEEALNPPVVSVASSQV
jgi:hypothetical protein